ncbi:hypothetical protein BU16DRAFT_4685 [Lophium mytilinum]|uniref:BTB domain-containing protein n=1 Tax=Lophium mytilinum TaxID=390894 RepID=A0A6A6RD44_9PEZI|nr:hypothetical protein BU16DRAFT_4685 [Lophium mytilinum]
MADIRRPASKVLDFSSPTVIVRVGPPNKSEDFFVHENLLRESSGFFAGALRGGWRESVDGVVPLPETSPDQFRIYCSWIYSRKIHTSGEIGLEESLEKRDEVARKEVSGLIKCWLLGERILDTNFKDAVMDMLVHLYDSPQLATFHLGDIGIVYNETLAGSPLRRLVVEVAATRLKADKSRELGKFFVPSEFTADLLVRLSRSEIHNMDGHALAAPHASSTTTPEKRNLVTRSLSEPNRSVQLSQR